MGWELLRLVRRDLSASSSSVILFTLAVSSLTLPMFSNVSSRDVGNPSLSASFLLLTCCHLAPHRATLLFQVISGGGIVEIVCKMMNNVDD